MKRTILAAVGAISLGFSGAAAAQKPDAAEVAARAEVDAICAQLTEMTGEEGCTEAQKKRLTVVTREYRAMPPVTSQEEAEQRFTEVMKKLQAIFDEDESKPAPAAKKAKPAA